jgi:F-type H+-transporting ATPase subunit b
MLNAFVATAAEEATEQAPSLLIPEIYDLVWGSIAFAIILVLFMWKVLPRLNEALDARADAIEGGIKRAEEAQASAKEALDQYTAQLSDARGEAAQIREQAREDAKQIRAELIEQAQADAARVVANATAQIEAERQSALVSLRSEVGAIALDLASGVIGESLSNDKRSTDIVDRFLADLEASEKSSAKAKA